MWRMNEFFKILFITVVAIMAFGFLRTKTASAEAITAAEGKAKVKAGALLLDVRAPGEYVAGHVEGAVNIPHDQIESRLSEITGDKNKEIVLYCKSGRRAGIALETLAKNGYSHVYNAGGYSDWVKD